ncbi:hypothetical protein ACWXWU_05210 [Shewanella sp. A14]
MGLPVTVYRNTDVGAPITIQSRTSHWITILKACLVDGYGDKSPLGWTLEYEGVYKAVFKNKVSDGGSGCFIRVSDIDGSNSQTGYTDFTIAKVMSDVDTYVDKIQLRRLRNYYSYVTGWTIIGTSRGFWIMQEATPSGTIDSVQLNFIGKLFMGDIDSLIPNDNNPFGILSGVSTTGDSTAIISDSIIGSSPALYLTCLGADGTNDKHQYGYDLSFKNTLSDGGDILTTDVPAILQRPMLSSLGGNGNPAFGMVRGFIPGLYELQHAGGRTLPLPLIRTFDGEDYQAIVGRYSPVLWIKISGNWYE